MAEILIAYFFPTLRLIENDPSARELVPVFVPSITTEAPGTGSFFSLVIFPVSLPVWAERDENKKERKEIHIIRSDIS
jgi:hypothetical protein